MSPQSISLPFSIPNVYQGLATANGMARATNTGLILEFEIKDGFVGMLTSGVNEIAIPINELSFIDLKIGWFRTRLFIATTSMARLKGVPGNQSGQISLGIARKDRNTARRFVSLLTMSLAERDLETLDKEIAQHRERGTSRSQSAG